MSPSQIPSQIGGYQIVGELGRGAMGVVYRAVDPRINRPVAIKVIRVDSVSTPEERASLRQRLIREATAAGRLSHPGIVTVHQLGEDESSVFIVMELVQGIPLDGLVRSNPTLPRILEILRQVADALDYAHQNGVIHRDVKPANILVREDGAVKIADFGIAKMLQSTTQGLTAAGDSLGSPAYMSPEQVRAENLDGRSDQFSLAVIAYQMLTGRAPFGGDTAHAVMYQIISADPMSNPQTTQMLPPQVCSALQRALAKDPKSRFATCSEFVRALSSQALPPDPRMIPSDSQTTRTQAVGQKSSMAIPLVLIAVILLLGLGGGGYWWWSKHKGGGESGGTSGSGAKAELPLIKAIFEGRLDDAKKLLDGRANVNGANPDGTTALMQAAEGSAYIPNNAPAVTLLLDKGANVEAKDARGRTALHRAAGEGKEEAVGLLLAHKADPNAKATDGSTPLMQAITYGKPGVATLLLASGAEVDAADAQANTPLMIAAEGTGYMPNNAPLVQLLLDKNAKLETQDARGRTALLRAAAEGKEDALRLLIEHKANINARASDGSSPLLQAITYGKRGTMQMLLEHGADIELGDSQGNRPLMVAAEGSAYMPNNAPMVEAILAQKPQVDAQDARGRTALFRAAAEGKDEALKLLLDKKANPNQKASDGATPLLEAVTYGRLGCATLLLDHGAEVDPIDSGGATPLMIAAEGTPYIKQSADFVKLLLEHGAKASRTDNQGRTALSRATEAKNTSALEALKK